MSRNLIFLTIFFLDSTLCCEVSDCVVSGLSRRVELARPRAFLHATFASQDEQTNGTEPSVMCEDKK